MDKEQIIKKINEFLVDELELDENQIKPQANLRNDLEIESLDFVDIAVIVEKEFGFKVVGEEMINVKTLQDLYDYIILKVKNNK